MSNPPNPWQSEHVEWIDAPPAELTVFEERAASVLSRNDSPDLGFRYSVNPYRGCQHACAYCYARPTHQYLDMGAGTDFDTKIVVKINAAERLREAFCERSWRGELICFSGNTDCYQPLEASYRLTRRCLEVCREFRNPVGLITKGALIRRDLDILADLARSARLTVFISVPFRDAALARAIEPLAPGPAARFATIRALSAAGIRVGVGVAPVIPGLNDDQVPAILEAARDAGATRAFRTPLRLAPAVLPVFVERLESALAGRAARVMAAFTALRGDTPGGGGFGSRMRGEGPRWQVTEKLFALTCRRLGLAASAVEDARFDTLAETTFRRPGVRQAELWEKS